MRPRRVWAPEEVELLRELYPDTETKLLAERFGCEMHQVYNKAHGMGLKKSAEFFASQNSGRLDGVIGSSTRFHKGLDPWNKGKKIVLPEKCKATQFKPGRKPQTWVPIGTERISRDGYLERKIADVSPSRRSWRAVHILLWEEVNGPLPEGHAVVFRDGNKKNLVYENLELLSRAELMRRNTIHRYPPELKQAIRLVAKLKRKIGAVDEKQD